MNIDKKDSQNIVNIDKSQKHKYNINLSKIVFGFIAFLIIFLIIIPIFLFKTKQYTILEA